MLGLMKPAHLLRTECIDVVILDLVLGKESGLELLKRIADEFPLVAVLVLSMHEDRLYAERVIRAGARGYITKSEATETLVGAIRGAVAGRLHLSDTMKMRVIQRIATPGKTGASPIDGLSDRELEVLRLIASGKSNAQIASILNRSVKTVEAHKSTLKTKLNVQSATELMRAALQYLEPT